jgi:hypothetical protein
MMGAHPIYSVRAIAEKPRHFILDGDEKPMTGREQTARGGTFK